VTVDSTDDRFVAAFRDGSLPGEEFPHREHVRMAWLYLERHPTAEALVHFSADLRRFAAAKGNPGLYHETITWAYLLLIAERRVQQAGQSIGPIGGAVAETYPEFAARNPDLFTWKPSLLERYYLAETLASPRARARFLLPDRLAAGA
jgi:hypothetical protein